MTSAEARIRAVVEDVLGTNSRLYESVISTLQTDLLAAREMAADAAEKRWVSDLGVESVVRALAPRKERKTRKPRKPKVELLLASPVLPVAPPEANFSRSSLFGAAV